MMLSGAGTLRFIAAGCLSSGVTRGRPKVWCRTPPQAVVSSAPGRDDQLADVAVRNGVLLVAVDDCPGHGRGGDAGNDVLDPATGCEYVAGLDGVRVEHLACHRQLEWVPPDPRPCALEVFHSGERVALDAAVLVADDREIAAGSPSVQEVSTRFRRAGGETRLDRAAEGFAPAVKQVLGDLVIGDLVSAVVLHLLCSILNRAPGTVPLARRLAVSWWGCWRAGRLRSQPRRGRRLRPGRTLARRRRRPRGNAPQARRSPTHGLGAPRGRRRRRAS